MFLLVLLILALIGLLAFIYRYGRYSPWRRYRQGRVLMMQTVFLSLALVYLIADILLPDPWPGEQILLYISAMGVVISVWGMFLGLLSSQRHGSTEAEKISGMDLTPDDDRTEPEETINGT